MGLPDEQGKPGYAGPPRVPRWQVARAAIVHDLMRNDTRWPKLLGDYVFLEAMGVDRVPLGRRLIAFVAVLLNFNRT